MRSSESQWLAAPLAHRVGAEADAAQIADAVAAVWRQIDADLSPVFGLHGVAALYLRSVHLVKPAHPWLDGADDGAQTAIDFATLAAALARQHPVDAAAGGSALLQTFHDLLASLVGVSLTERLLRSAWTNAAGSPPAKDTAS